MHTIVDIKGYKESDNGTELKVLIPTLRIGDLLVDKHIKKAEMRFDDGRTISAEQRRKVFALLNDISEWNGDIPEALKEHMKYYHMAKVGCEHFSLSDCTMTDAREFINTLIEFCLENSVPLSDSGANLTDDMSRYLYFCIMNKKCCICGQNGEIHHVQRIGMGANRNKVDDTEYPKMCLCRKHHTQCHTMPQTDFNRMYHVEGIIVKGVEAVD